MRDVLVVTGVIAFFLLGAAYIALCARILADTGDIDEPNLDDDIDEADEAETQAETPTSEMAAR